MNQQTLYRGVWNKKWDQLFTELDVYSAYIPNIDIIAEENPTNLVEATYLAHVNSPKSTFQLFISPLFYKSIREGNIHITRPQLEAIFYATQSFQATFDDENGMPIRQGFCIGDSLLVGMERILAGIAFQCFLDNDEKAVWVTADDKFWQTIRTELTLYHPNVQVITTSDLTQPHVTASRHPALLLLTYDNLGTRKALQQVAKWMKTDFNGLIIFDEFNQYEEGSNGTAIEMAVHNMQMENPMAKVVYSMASGVSELAQLFAMHRLGLWGQSSPFLNVADFRNKLSFRPGALQFVLMDMKRKGVYLSRQMSFEGLDIKILECNEDKEFELIYQRSTELMALLLVHLDRVKQLWKTKMRDSSTDSEQDHVKMKQYLALFYLRMREFFGSIMVWSKINTTVNCAIAKRRLGECSIITLLESGEKNFAIYEQELPWSGNLPFSNAAYILRCLMRSLGIRIGCPKMYSLRAVNPVKVGKWTCHQQELADSFFEDVWKVEYPNDNFTLSDKQRFGLHVWPSYAVGSFITEAVDPQNLSWSYDSVVTHQCMDGLARLYHELVPFLPINPIDHIIQSCEEKQLRVVELTARSKHHVRNASDNKWEIQAKNDAMQTAIELSPAAGKFAGADIAIISADYKNDSSLQLDKILASTRQANHFLVEYGFSHDKILHLMALSLKNSDINQQRYYLVQSLIPVESENVTAMCQMLKHLGAICPTKMDTACLSEDLCADVRGRIFNEGLDDLRKMPLFGRLLEIMEVKNIVGNCQKSSEFPTKIQVQVIEICKRLLMLHPYIQTIFFDAVRKACARITSSASINYRIHGINLYGLERKVITKIPLMIREQPASLIRIRVNRVAYPDWCEQFLFENSTFECYLKGTKELLLASPPDEIGICRAVFPFSRHEITIPVSTIIGWEKKRWRDIVDKWQHAVNAIEANVNSCSEKRLLGKCYPEVPCGWQCMHQWGIAEFCVLTNPSSHVIAAIDARNIQLLHIKEVGDLKEVFGIFVGSNNDNVQQLVKKYGTF